MKNISLFVLFIIPFWIEQSFASIIVYSDEVAFLNATTGIHIESFEDDLYEPGVAVMQMSTGEPWLPTTNNNFVDYVLTTGNSTTWTIDLGNGPLTAWGATFNIEVAGTGPGLEFSINGSSAGTSDNGFWGIAAYDGDNLGNTITISAVNALGNEETYTMDDMLYSTTAPVPSGAILFLSGLVVFGAKLRHSDGRFQRATIS